MSNEDILLLKCRYNEAKKFFIKDTVMFIIGFLFCAGIIVAGFVALNISGAQFITIASLFVMFYMTLKLVAAYINSLRIYLNELLLYKIAINNDDDNTKN